MEKTRCECKVFYAESKEEYDRIKEVVIRLSSDGWRKVASYSLSAKQNADIKLWQEVYWFDDSGPFSSEPQIARYEVGNINATKCGQIENDLTKLLNYETYLHNPRKNFWGSGGIKTSDIGFLHRKRVHLLILFRKVGEGTNPEVGKNSTELFEEIFEESINETTPLNRGLFDDIFGTR